MWQKARRVLNAALMPRRFGAENIQSAETVAEKLMHRLERTFHMLYKGFH